MATTKVVRFHELGSADVLQIEELPLEEPKAGEVRITVEAFGLNRAEAMFRQGQYLFQPRFPSRIGTEAAGVVDAVAENVTNVKVGDRVSVAPGFSAVDYGTYGESTVVPADVVLPYPENLSPVEAAAIWVQYLTTYYAFVDLGRLQAGQHVLITAASSSTGQSAIEMTRLFGAASIATTRTAAKKQALLAAGANHVIVTDEEDLPKRVMEITGGKGAELIYDPVAGSALEKLAEAVAWGGQIILYGMLSMEPTPYPLVAALNRNFTLRTYGIYNYVGLPTAGLPRNEEAFTRGVKFISEALSTGKLKPVIAKTFPLSEIREAHRYLESNQQMGKIVVTV